MAAAEEPSAAVEYDKWLLTVGDGTNQLPDDFVNLPENKTQIISSSSLKKAVNWVFENFQVNLCFLNFFQRILERNIFLFQCR